MKAFGNTRLDEITTEDVQRLKAALTERAPKTVNNILTTLSVVLRTAVEWNVIARVHVCHQAAQGAEGRGDDFDEFDEFERLSAFSRPASAWVSASCLACVQPFSCRSRARAASMESKTSE